MLWSLAHALGAGTMLVQDNLVTCGPIADVAHPDWRSMGVFSQPRDESEGLRGVDEGGATWQYVSSEGVQISRAGNTGTGRRWARCGSKRGGSREATAMAWIG